MNARQTSDLLEEARAMAAEENPARAIRRLEARKVLRPMVDKMYEEGLRAAQSGEPVAWCMGNWLEGDAILRAMGVIQVFPENYGAVCAAMGVAPGFLSRCEAEGFPTHMCGYARNCIGYTARMVELGDIPPEAPMGGMPKPMLLVGSGMACDARYKWFQALRRYLEVPIWILEMPTPGYGGTKRERTYDSTMRYVVAELRDFVTFLEGLLQKKMDWDKLCEMVDNMEKVQRVWWEALEMRKAIPCPMHSRDLWSIAMALCSTL
jgi:benzoyl-CoA reductase/2-hydroxyglutaryl-CoA dehydratase subunit BcrC/BadD/HgdB